MSAVDLHAVRTGFLRAARAVDEVLHEALHFLVFKGAHGGLGELGSHGGGSDGDLPLIELGKALVARVLELEENL